jgi:hypothetical protein
VLPSHRDHGPQIWRSDGSISSYSGYWYCVSALIKWLEAEPLVFDKSSASIPRLLTLPFLFPSICVILVQGNGRFRPFDSTDYRRPDRVFAWRYVNPALASVANVNWILVIVLTLFFYDSFLILGDEVSGLPWTPPKVSDSSNRWSISIGEINNDYYFAWSSAVVIDGFRRPWNLTSVIYAISKIGGIIFFPYAPHAPWFNLSWQKFDCFRIAFGEILGNLPTNVLDMFILFKHSNGKNRGGLYYDCKSRASSPNTSHMAY